MIDETVKYKLVGRSAIIENFSIDRNYIGTLQRYIKALRSSTDSFGITLENYIGKSQITKIYVEKHSRISPIKIISSK